MIRNRNISLKNDKYLGPLPKIATLSLEAASAKNKGAIVWDETDGIVKYSTGSAWTSVGTGGGATTLAALTDTDLTSPASGHILLYDGTNSWDNKAVSGDITITSGGVAAIAAGVVVNADIKSDAGIVVSKIALTTGSLMLGAASVGSELDASTDGGIIIGDGATAAVQTISGDVALTNAGVTTVTDLTISGEVEGNILYFDGSNWVRLAVGTSGQFLKTQGAAAPPIWDTVSAGTASGLSDPFTIETGGAGDISIDATAQAAVTVTIPDLGGVAQDWVFTAEAQTLTNKTLTSAVLNTGVSGTAVLDEDAMGSDSDTQVATQQSIKAYVDTQVATKIGDVVSDTTPQLGGDLDLNSKNIDFPSTANISDCKDEDDMASDSATMLATQQSIKAYVDGGAVTFTNKTLDAQGTGNALSNVSANELDSGVVGTDLDLIPFVISKDVSNAATTVIFNANAPYKFRILDAWVVSTAGANSGTWKLDNGTNDITTAVNYGTSDTDLVRCVSIDDSYHEIASSGTLRCINSSATDDALLYILAIRVD